MDVIRTTEEEVKTMGKFKILIIEDEKQMAMFIEMELNHEGYKTDIAYDGIEGLKKIENDKYDLVILDFLLPGLNGIEVCKEVRKFSKVQIIMVTAKSDISYKVKGLDIGANDYMTKPFAIEELLARIRVVQRDDASEYKYEEIKLGDLVMNNNSHIIKYNI